MASPYAALAKAVLTQAVRDAVDIRVHKGGRARLAKKWATSAAEVSLWCYAADLSPRAFVEACERFIRRERRRLLERRRAA